MLRDAAGFSCIGCSAHLCTWQCWGVQALVALLEACAGSNSCIRSEIKTQQALKSFHIDFAEHLQSTPLHLIVLVGARNPTSKYNMKQMVKSLKKFKSNFNMTSAKGKTPFKLAQEVRDVNFPKELIHLLAPSVVWISKSNHGTFLTCPSFVK